jgi:ATP-binding cassette subfamily B protein/subfamily B ATP-binding cassette protein MsbA
MNRTLRHQLWTLVWPYRGLLGLACVQIVLLSSIELLKPWPLKLIIDHVLGGYAVTWPLLAEWSHKALLGFACLALVGIHALAGGLTLMTNSTKQRLGHALVHDLRSQLFAHLQRLSLAFHAHSQVGDLLYRLTSDTRAIQHLTTNGILPLLTSLVFVLGMAVIMLQLDWLLTLLALSICPLLWLTTSTSHTRIDQAATTARDTESAFYALVQCALASVRLIQAFTREEAEHQRVLSASAANLAAILRVLQTQTLYAEGVNLVIAVGTAVVVGTGASHVLTGRLSLGELVIFITYLASLYQPIHTGSRSLGLIGEAKAGLTRVYETLAVGPDVLDGTRQLSPALIRGEVRFAGVTFNYTSPRPVLRDVDLYIAPGQTVAIVGPTGAGKSTLLGLLLRFYDPQAGHVFIDGTDIRAFTLASLRQHIAMVLQPPMVFPGTVRDNIAYGQPDASSAAIAHAARLACIHEAILRLPHGYDTVIGEQGATLSEGERQRLTIARALLRDAPLLLLDEPTSAVDAETEALIMEGLEQLRGSRTTFIIAHRLSTVQRADVIVVMQEGRIVEQGNYAALMRRQGVFATLYHTQFTGSAAHQARESVSC